MALEKGDWSSSELDVVSVDGRGGCVCREKKSHTCSLRLICMIVGATFTYM